MSNDVKTSVEGNTAQREKKLELPLQSGREGRLRGGGGLEREARARRGEEGSGVCPGTAWWPRTVSVERCRLMTILGSPGNLPSEPT